MKKLTVVLAVLLVACIAFAEGAKEVQKDTELRMQWWGGEPRTPNTLKALEMYTAKTGIKTIGEPESWDGYKEQLFINLSGGTAADLIQADAPWLPELTSMDAGIFAEIDPKVVDLSQFSAEYLAAWGTYNGKLIGIPTGVNVNTFIVDPAMLSAAGIDPNTKWTWENIVSEGKKIHEKNSSNYFLGSDLSILQFWFEMYMAQVAGGVIDDNGNVLFTEAQCKQAFDYFKQWFDYGIVQPLAQSSLYYEAYSDNPVWVNGQEACAWTWVSSMKKDMAGRSGMETRQLPVMAGAKDSGVLARPSQMFVIPASSKNKDEAMKLMAYMLLDTEAVKTLGTCRSIPSGASAVKTLQSAGLLDDLTANATNEGMAQAGGKQSNVQQNSLTMKAMREVIEQFGYGKIDSSKAAKLMIEGLKAAYKEI